MILTIPSILVKLKNMPPLNKHHKKAEALTAPAFTQYIIFLMRDE